MALNDTKLERLQAKARAYGAEPRKGLPLLELSACAALLRATPG